MRQSSLLSFSQLLNIHHIKSIKKNMECKRWKVIALLGTFVNLRLASIRVIPLL